MRRAARAAAAIIILASAGARLDAQAYTRMANFGDSLSDAGNVYSITGGFYPGPKYYNGRLSNGPVWVEGLATRLSLPAVTASRSGGLNFATGGSHTGSGHTMPFPIISLPNAGTQVESFLGTSAPAPDDLLTLWAGANDFLDGETDPLVPAGNMAAHVQRLVNAGSRSLLVVNLPLIGDTPRYRNTANRATMNARSAQYNAALSVHLDAIAAASPSATLYRVDIAGLFASAMANPAAYGLTNVTEAALRSDGTIAANVDQYLFYDEVHPTRVGHALFASIAFETVTTRTLAPNLPTLLVTWSDAASWAQHRVPDATSAVTIGGGGAQLAAPAAVRRLGVDNVSQLELASTASIAVSDDFTLSGRVALTAANADAPPITVGDHATLVGSIALRFGNGFIALPGTQLPLVTFATADGSPQIVNETGFAGLELSAIFSPTSLAIGFDATNGDANLDAAVNFTDLVALAQHYGQASGQDWLDGDFTGDGGVSFPDLVALAQHYGATSAGFAADWALAQSLVPEPSVLGFAGVAVAASRRRRRVARR